jgi:hypothetical protein
MAARTVFVLESDSDISQKLCDLVIEKANCAIEKDGKFTIGLSGSLYMFMSSMSSLFVNFLKRKVSIPNPMIVNKTFSAQRGRSCFMTWVKAW